MTSPLLRATVLSSLTSVLCATLAAQGGDMPRQGLFHPGLAGFDRFHEPIGQPIYFESPFNDTGLRALYLRHEFGDGSALGGGDLTVYALQIRAALTERLQFIATKDGYSDLQATNLPNDTGLNDLAAGLKYVFAIDKEQDLVAAAGFRYQLDSGNARVLQGTTDEVSPFVSVAKGFGDLHVVGCATLRVPIDDDKGNTVGHWDVHVDYDVNPQSEAVFAPVLELHGVHYLSDGASALPIGGLDYANLGSKPAKNFVAWAGIGGRVEFAEHRMEAGIVYEFAVTDPDEDIMDRRITADFIFRF